VKIYDCFTFANELDVLDIRLHELDALVDTFVLVEAPRTFRGEEKPLQFDLNRERYARFASRIVHIVVSDIPLPVNGDRWIPQIYQRRAIVRGLPQCAPDDIVMVSDVDEIPDPALLGAEIDALRRPDPVQDALEWMYGRLRRAERRCTRCRNRLVGRLVRRAQPFVFPRKRIFRFSHRHYEYYLNGYVTDFWPGCTVMRYSALESVFDMDCHETRKMWSERTTRFVKGGWHFSYLGGAASIAAKLRSLSDKLCDNEDVWDEERVRTCIERGENLFGKPGDKHRIKYVPLDETFPRYVLTHQQELATHIMDL